jgi:gluconate 2-dehydrogenase gamma chain
MKGAKNQGHQSEQGPAQQYRDGLAALNASCKAQLGKAFHELSDADKDRVLHELESGEFNFDGTDGKAFFAQVVKDVQMGFFADPIYGGNRDMVAWKMIGFPGARYDHRAWVEQHDKPYTLPPVAIALPQYGGGKS